MKHLKEDFKQYKGHIHPPLFTMIPLKNWVPDELHVMLRITDRLWDLMLAEVKSQKFDNEIRDIICEEMKRIKVKFSFWQDQRTWLHTSLMGDDKIKVIKLFNLNTILPSHQAEKIHNLWNSFYGLYQKMKDVSTNPEDFAIKTKAWLDLFLTPSTGTPNTVEYVKGLYRPNDITPYIHVFVFHIHEFIKFHQGFGLSAFSCAPIEKKNHQHVSHFFRGTFKDGGAKETNSSAIVEILQLESRMLYYWAQKTPISFPKNKKLRISQ